MKYSLAFFVMVIFCAITTGSFAQDAAATALVNASIVQPVRLVKVRDLNFGKIAAGVTPGTVVLAPSEAGNRTASGGVTLPSGSSTVYSAKFIVSGVNGYSYSIALPASTITLSNGINNMTIDNFTSTPSDYGTFSPGSQTIWIGATLNVNANQEPGLYESEEDFEITVNYN